MNWLIWISLFHDFGLMDDQEVFLIYYENNWKIDPLEDELFLWWVFIILLKKDFS